MYSDMVTFKFEQQAAVTTTTIKTPDNNGKKESATRNTIMVPVDPKKNNGNQSVRWMDFRCLNYIMYLMSTFLFYRCYNKPRRFCNMF